MIVRHSLVSVSVPNVPRMTDAAADGSLALIAAAGGYLRNVVREPGVTCRVCATPASGFELCYRCRQHQRVGRLADMVAPLTYAVGCTESAALLRDYKNHPVRAVRKQRGLVVGSLLRLGITAHERCIAAVVGMPVSLRVVIPSLTYRPGTHPLTDIARSVGALGEAALVPGPTAVCDRSVRAGKFTLQPRGAAAGKHVLVLDDVWTTGSNAQSAALTLRQAGAAAVSVMVVGRWLSPGHPPTAQFIETRLQRDYDPDICPVTGSRCVPKSA